MPKVFRIKDEDGKEYEVKETEEKTVETDDADEEKVELSVEEIAAVRKLLPHADKIVEFFEKMSKDVTDEDEDEDKDMAEEEEEIIDTDETCSKKDLSDAVRSAGKIERKTKTEDSTDIQEEINAAWLKRYGGNV